MRIIRWAAAAVIGLVVSTLILVFGLLTSDTDTSRLPASSQSVG